MAKIECPICKGSCVALDVVDFNKSCEEANGLFFQLSGVPIYYYWCTNCQFCFAPEIYSWPPEDYAQFIYNQDYVLVDPDYVEARPNGNAQMLLGMFELANSNYRHLDFGGGNGALSSKLRDAGWDSRSYDPFANPEIEISSLGQFDLITAFEVFEHVPDVNALMTSLSSLANENSIVIFSTLLSDNRLEQNKRITWWYASPRNGHISLFSRKSLVLISEKQKLHFGSFSDNLHAFWHTIPGWASHLFPQE